MSEDLRRGIRECMTVAFSISSDQLSEKADVENVQQWDSLGHLALFEELNAKYPGKLEFAKFRMLLSEDDILQALS
ncbi:hypothetical protein [Thalassospira povalilytica]|uniref:hypothetical protein n=1 Tax=Thalassospira povalilytica TaxID=732237 RepID=UPI003AA8070C